MSDSFLGTVEELKQKAPSLRRVHHLNCLTMCPVAGTLWHASGGLVCHCLLIETEQGLVLVDTALGTEALTHPPLHTTAFFRRVFRPRLDVEQTAVKQIERLGFEPDDVQHIILTHLDLDHAGGLPDFPHATVHVMADEHTAAMQKRTLMEKERYVSSLWAHDVRWALHKPDGENWFGFECVREIAGLPPEILLVPLVGHTRGHAGVAIDVGDRWLLHCGDAYFSAPEVDPDRPRGKPVLTAFQKVVAVDERARQNNQARLRELKRNVGEGISVFCAHDPDDYGRLRG